MHGLQLPNLGDSNIVDEHLWEHDGRRCRISVPSATDCAHAHATSGLYPHLEVKRLVEGRREIVGVFREPGCLGAVVATVYIPFSVVR